MHCGNGFELRTDDWGAIRAGKGLYISTDKREKAEGEQLDIQEAISQLEEALQLAKNLANASEIANGLPQNISAQEERLQSTFQSLQNPAILMSAPEGIALASPKNIQLSSGESLTLTTKQSLDSSQHEDVRISAGKNVSLFALEEAMKLIANKGEMQIQAQHNQLEMSAQKQLKILSTEDKLEIAAEKEILLTSGGAYIRIKDGNIELHAPGEINHKGAAFSFGSATGIDYAMPTSRSFLLKEIQKLELFLIFKLWEMLGLFLIWSVLMGVVYTNLIN